MRARHSVRAFLDRPVDRATIAEILETARFAPSGGNLQPWHVDVLAAGALADLKEKVRASFAADPAGDGTEFNVYPPALGEPWRGRRFASGEQLYAAIGIPREDRPARLSQFAKNFDLFGAPVGSTFTKRWAATRPIPRPDDRRGGQVGQLGDREEEQAERDIDHDRHPVALQLPEIVTWALAIRAARPG